MSTKHKISMIVLIGLHVVVFGTQRAFPATVDEIAQELTCTCGCNMLVSACEGTMECGAAAYIKDQIVEQMKSGKSKEEIIAFFVDEYGEQILSSPTKRGFNLTAWVLPFVAVIFGTGAVCVLLKNWTSRKKPGPEQVSFKQEDNLYLERIEEELKIFDR